MPTSILIELLLSGGMRKECTQMPFSFTTYAMQSDIVTRMKYTEWIREEKVVSEDIQATNRISMLMPR